MRAPTPVGQLFAWYNRAMAGGVPEINDEPQCGWFKRKLTRGGPFVAARIWMEQQIDEGGELAAPEVLCCEIGGQRRDPGDQWTYLAANPISRHEYEFLTKDAGWARRNAPDDPAANPHQPVDHMKTPILF